MSNFADDVAYRLGRKGLHVEPPTRTIDFNTVPRDGHEFIHKSRLENAKLDDVKQEKYMEPTANKVVTATITHYASILASEKERAFLKKKFPKKLSFPKNGPNCIQEWCNFCLGSKLCSEIYKEMYEVPDVEMEGHLPLLSIIIHFNQHRAFTVLKHLHTWFLSIGMEKSLGKWVFAVLACIRRPLDSSTKELFDTFYNDCQKRLRDCDDLNEKKQLEAISAALKCNVKVNSD